MLITLLHGLKFNTSKVELCTNRTTRINRFKTGTVSCVSHTQTSKSHFFFLQQVELIKIICQCALLDRQLCRFKLYWVDSTNPKQKGLHFIERLSSVICAQEMFCKLWGVRNSNPHWTTTSLIHFLFPYVVTQWWNCTLFRIWTMSPSFRFSSSSFVAS